MLTRTAKTRSAVSAASVMSPEPAWTPRVASASVRSCENSFHTRSAFDFAYEKPQGWDQCSIKMKTKIIFSGPHVNHPARGGVRSPSRYMLDDSSR